MMLPTNKIFIEATMSNEKPKRKSGMSVHVWTEKTNPDTGKLYTEEEARFKVRSFRKLNKEYWLVRGYTEEESVLKVSEFQKENMEKLKKNKKNNPEKYKASNPKVVQYWIKRGYTEKEAKKKISESQKTFSLEICIRKHGEELGHKVWKERQDKWQETLKSKTPEEKRRISKLKALTIDNYIAKHGEREGRIKYKQHWTNKGSVVYDTEDKFKEYVESLLEDKSYLKYLPIEQTISKIPAPTYALLDIDINEFLLSIYEFPTENLPYRHGGSYHGYTMYTEDGVYLRSLREIESYYTLLDLNINFEVDMQYNNSKLRSDFYLTDYDIHVELAGLLFIDEYRNKMLYKQNTFKPAILLPDDSLEEFIMKVKKGESIESYITRDL